MYPDRRTLLAALNEGHGCVAECFARLPDALFDGQSPFVEARREMPTLGDLLLYLLCTHEGIHLGQLSAWRRAQGLPAV